MSRAGAHPAQWRTTRQLGRRCCGPGKQARSLLIAGRGDCHFQLHLAAQFNTADDIENAIADMTRAIQLNPKYAVAHGMRGILRFALHKDADGAIADLTPKTRAGIALVPMCSPRRGTSQLMDSAFRGRADRHKRRSRPAGGQPAVAESFRTTAGAFFLPQRISFLWPHLADI